MDTLESTFVLSGSYVPEPFFDFTTRNDGHVDVDLEGAAADFTGYLSPVGSFAVSLPGAVAAFAGYVVPQGAFAVALDAASASFVAGNVTNIGSFSVVMDGAAGAFSAEYDANVHRYTVAEWCAGQAATALVSGSTVLSRGAGGVAIADVAAECAVASPVNAETASVVDATVLAAVDACGSVNQGTALFGVINAVAEQMTPVEQAWAGWVDDGALVEANWLSICYQLELIYTEFVHGVEDAGADTLLYTHIRRVYGDSGINVYIPDAGFVLAVDAYTPVAVFGWDYQVPALDYVIESRRGTGIKHNACSFWQSATPYFVKKCSLIQDARRPPDGANVWIDPPRPPPVTPPGHTVFTIPTQSVYFMQHALSVTLLDLTPVSMASVRLSLDADAYAWQFSGQLLKLSDVALVQQAPGQPPVQLIITINGVAWKVLVERIERQGQFAKNSINLIGRGLSVLLSQPYEQPASATQGSALTVQQLADSLMPSGWTVYWLSPTWVVTAGAFSYMNKTPMQALASIASDIGAVVVPARNSQAVTIMPRYPYAPWDYDLAVPDVMIPEAALLSITEQAVIPSQANGVYVHGAEIGGVMAWCRLNSTDGSRLAPTVSNALLTDVIGCRALGERILAGQYQQPALKAFTIPFDGVSFPLIAIGQLVDVVLGGVHVRGIANSVSIEASLGHVRQSVQMGEETANSWALFKELMPRDPLLVATLSSTDGVTALMTLLDGGVVRVRGTGTVGGKYYIRAGRIEGSAPAMTASEVVI